MGAHKHISSNNISTRKPASGPTPSSNSNLDDYAQEGLWLATGLQALFIAGSYWKIPLLSSGPIFFRSVTRSSDNRCHCHDLATSI